MTQTVFKRYEKKYLLNPAQHAALAGGFDGRMAADARGVCTVFSLYYDTDDFALIRASIEKPLYKEKLRLRCYGAAGEDTPVFLELKKKYRGVVYKRRAKLAYRDAEAVLSRKARAGGGQILREISWFLDLHPVSGKLLLCYERAAFSCAEDPGLRITFDTDVRFRRNGLRLDGDARGAPLLSKEQILMEIKTAGTIPPWLCRALSDLKIFPISFSKYGSCYRDHIAKEGRAGQEVSLYA
jgi:hypothetical protein